jgi:segregation and condensation protein A
MIDFLRRRLMLEDRPVRLKQILRTLQSQNALLCAFLAILEMVRIQAVQLRQDQTFGDILIRKYTNFDSIAGENSATRDDWR